MTPTPAAPCSKSPKKRPSGWAFMGFFAYYLCGAVNFSTNRLDVVIFDDSLKGSGSRAQSRSAKKKEKEEQRSRNIGNPNNLPGLCLNDRVALADVSFSAETLSACLRESKAISIKLELDVVERKINRAIKRGLEGIIEEIEKGEQFLQDQLRAVSSSFGDEKENRDNFQHLIDLSEHSSTPKFPKLA